MEWPGEDHIIQGVVGLHADTPGALAALFVQMYERMREYGYEPDQVDVVVGRDAYVPPFRLKHVPILVIEMYPLGNDPYAIADAQTENVLARLKKRDERLAAKRAQK